jgi:hypothetical protein
MIYTFGDGFAAGHIWPEWPQLLEPIIQTSVKNFGHIGAGNEYIFNCAVKSALTATFSDTFLIQWAHPIRFDKLLEDDSWDDLQKTDDVYRDLIAESFEQRWWCSSKSELPDIIKYNEFYIQSQQAINRSILYMITLSGLLDKLSIPHLYFLTYSFDYSSHKNYPDIKKLPWIDLNQGMCEWSDLYPDLRGDNIQPRPFLHAKYIFEKILPGLNIKLDTAVQEQINDRLSKIYFTAYDPDRDQIWSNLKNEINMLFK